MELHYPNAVYDAIAAPYVQYTQPSTESTVVGNLKYVCYGNVTLLLYREFMSNAITQQSMHLWIRLHLEWREFTSMTLPYLPHTTR